MPTYVSGWIARCIAGRLKNKWLAATTEYRVPNSDAEKWRNGSGARIGALILLQYCVPNISLFKHDTEYLLARAAGWRACDLDWERLQEGAFEAWYRGDVPSAVRSWRWAWLVARLNFRKDDPRSATSTANLGLVARLAGRERLARRRYAIALRRWGGVVEHIDGMAIARRGRSSLFHLRMEIAHWGAYDQQFRAQAMRLASDIAVRLDLASLGQPSPGQRSLRWSGEKPCTFDDLRKFLGAALLIAGDAGKLDHIQN